MRAFLIGLLVAVVSATGAQADIAPPPTAPVAPQATGDAARVPLAVLGGLPVIDVTVNGNGPFKFAVDTGAGGQAHISSALAAKLALNQVGEARVADGSGQNAKRVPLFGADSLVIGDITFRGLTVAATDSRSGMIDGVIGMGLLREFLLTLDYPGKALMLEKGELPAADGAHVFDYQPGRVIIVLVKVGDVEIPAHLDTGNARHPFIVSADILPKLATRGEPRAIGQAHTVSNTVDMFAIDVTAPVRIGAVTLPIKEISYPAVAPGGNLGTLALLSVVMRLDQKNRRVSFTAP